MHAKTANTPLWSWGESNPRPSKGDRVCYDHSRVRGLMAATPPGRASREALPKGLSPLSAVFHAVSGLSLLSPPLLLPGCGGPTPRAVTGRDDSRSPDWVRRRERDRPSWRLCWCPVLGVWATPVARHDHCHRRRYRSAPWCGGVPWGPSPRADAQVLGCQGSAPTGYRRAVTRFPWDLGSFGIRAPRSLGSRRETTALPDSADGRRPRRFLLVRPL